MKVFLSYRREDSPGHAGRVRDALRHAFGPEHVFMDLDSVPSGVRFRERIDAAVAECDATLVLIGPHWLQAQTSDGQRRLDQQNDWVRAEVLAALKSSNPVVPVLVGGATIPPATELPDPIRGLVDYNAAEITERNWDYDVERLIEDLKRVGRDRGKGRGLPFGASVGEPEGTPGRRRVSRRAVAIAGVAALLVVGVVVGIVASSKGGPSSTKNFHVAGVPFTFQYPKGWTGPTKDASGNQIVQDNSSDAIFATSGTLDLTGDSTPSDMQTLPTVNRHGITYNVRQYVMTRLQGMHERDYVFTVAGDIWTIGCQWFPATQSETLSACQHAVDSLKPSG